MGAADLDAILGLAERGAGDRHGGCGMPLEKAKLEKSAYSPDQALYSCFPVPVPSVPVAQESAGLQSERILKHRPIANVPPKGRSETERP